MSSLKTIGCVLTCFLACSGCDRGLYEWDWQHPDYLSTQPAATQPEPVRAAATQQSGSVHPSVTGPAIGKYGR